MSLPGPARRARLHLAPAGGDLGAGDRPRHELGDLVRRAHNFSGGTDPLPAIRFRLQVERTPSGSYSPFLLHAVTPYEWGPEGG